MKEIYCCSFINFEEIKDIETVSKEFVKIAEILIENFGLTVFLIGSDSPLEKACIPFVERLKEKYKIHFFNVDKRAHFQSYLRNGHPRTYMAQHYSPMIYFGESKSIFERDYALNYGTLEKYASIVGLSDLVFAYDSQMQHGEESDFAYIKNAIDNLDKFYINLTPSHQLGKW